MTDHFQGDSKKSRDSYEYVAPVYDAIVGPVLKPVLEGVCRIARDLGSRKILDIACGTGMLVHALAENGFLAFGIDISPAMLSQAQATKHPRTAFLLGNGENLPFASESFDCVVLSLAVHEMKHSSAVQVVNEALRVLTSGGKLIVFDYRPGADLISRISLLLMHIPERLAGKRHYRNFKFFIKMGGLESFICLFPLKVLFDRKYFGGAAAIVVSEKREELK
jgi:ubiquinone/menaquinone biosynthesis C-methylase UbiE